MRKLNSWMIFLWLNVAGWARPRYNSGSTPSTIDLDAYKFSTMDKWFYYVGWSLMIWAFVKHCERTKGLSVIVLFLLCIVGGYLTATAPIGLVIVPSIYLLWPRKKKPEPSVEPTELGYRD